MTLQVGVPYPKPAPEGARGPMFIWGESGPSQGIFEGLYGPYSPNIVDLDGSYANPLTGASGHES